MLSTDLYLIVAAEIAGVLLVATALLGFKNRSLRLSTRAMKERLEKTMEQIKLARSGNSEASAQVCEQTSYVEYIESQVTNTRHYHENLGSTQDIALDIEPGTPLAHRTAALRHALLMAEIEAFANRDQAGEPDWKSLRYKYEQIFAFNEDYDDDSASEDNSAHEEELEDLERQLENSKKRAKNLEKFKTLYLDLEAKWDASSQEAQSQYKNLSQLAADADESGNLSRAIGEYHSVYEGVTKIIEGGVDAAISQTVSTPRDSSDELKRLREVAADQHKIIENLQRKLNDASSDEERAHVVSGLQGELQKQLRFAQESETCIQLLEDELTTTNTELDQLRSRSGKMQQVKTDLRELRQVNDELDLKVQSVSHENRKLQKKVKELASAPKVDSGDSRKLRRELSEMEEKYNDLEEKFLDLKLKQ
ncbi:MAG: hypothetical protein ACI93R_000586 [Flavobacteriales bacterium]|jgi:hypothetical protein